MPNRLLAYRTTVLTNAVESANNTETVVCTLAGVTCEYPGQTVRLSGWFKGTTGTGTTSGLLRLRRTSLTGTLVSEATPENVIFVASKTSEGVVCADDSPGELAGAVYVMTYTGAGDTSACTFLACKLTADIF
jgi:hypothetical protein